MRLRISRKARATADVAASPDADAAGRADETRHANPAADRDKAGRADRTAFGNGIVPDSAENDRAENGQSREPLKGPRGQVTERILEQIRAGRTVRAICATTGVSEVFVSTLLDHYDRLGLLDDAGSLCSSGLGACHTTNITDQVRVACAGCPIAI